MRFKSAFHASKDLVFAMAVDQTNSMNFLVKFTWTADSVELYPMQGLSEDPSASPGAYFGSAHLGSIIYA